MKLLKVLLYPGIRKKKKIIQGAPFLVRPPVICKSARFNFPKHHKSSTKCHWGRAQNGHRVCVGGREGKWGAHVWQLRMYATSSRCVQRASPYTPLPVATWLDARIQLPLFLCFTLQTVEACCLNFVTFHPFASHLHLTNVGLLPICTASSMCLYVCLVCVCECVYIYKDIYIYT